MADVFAYANRAHSGPSEAPERRSLVVYLNRYPRAHVRIPGVAEALELGHDPDGYLILHDQRSGLQYLRQLRDLRTHGLELSMDGYGCHVFLGFEEVSDVGGQGWAELTMRLGLGGVEDAHAALRRLREEPWREAVAALFDSPEVQVTFLPHPTGPELEPPREPVALTEGLARLAALAGTDLDVVGVAHDSTDRATMARGVRPRLLAQALAGWAYFEAVGRVACGGDPARTERAFDDWEASSAVGDLARRAGSTDTQAWRIVELARALLAIAPGALAAADSSAGLPASWFTSAAVRAASGWNGWQGATYIGQESWDELIDALAARDALLGVPAGAPAVELKRRAAAAGYRLDEAGSGPPARPSRA